MPDESSNNAKRTLDHAWQIAREVTAAGRCITLSSPALLLALCEARPARGRPSSSSTRFLDECMAARWADLAVERGMFVAGTAHRESAEEGCPLTPPASYILRLSGLIALDRNSRRLHRRDLLLALLLHPEVAGPSAAHDILHRVGLEPYRLATRFRAHLQPHENELRA